jgi:hypothetical protein
MSSHDAAAHADPALVPVLHAYRTAELLTVTRSGVPIAWPTLTMPRPDGTFLVTTSIALPQKAANVRRDPRVALLFSDPTGSGLDAPPQVLVQGTAVCPDEIVTSALPRADLWRRLSERQPTADAYRRTAIGRWLFDWYYMRLLLTVTPERWRTRPSLAPAEPLAPRAHAAPVPAPADDSDDAFALAVRRLPGFSSAVLAAFDAGGRPTLLRTRPRVDGDVRRFAVDVPAGEEPRPGPASLLCHSHDEKLWNLRSFVVRGTLERDGGTWFLRPERYVPGGDRMGPVTMVRTLRDLRRTARSYLDERGLERPRIPWEEYEALKAR